jgi:Zn-dependent protease
MPDIVDGLVFYVVFVLSTTLHEAAHAWAALRGGDSTAYEGGQVTLDPIPHIRREPFGMVVLPLISVLISGWPLGFASAPYNREWAAKYPQRAAWMALAGPAANLLLVVIAGVLINIGLQTGVFVPPGSINFADVTAAAAGAASVWDPIAYLVGSFFAMNLLLFVFNLIPVPPLDGSAVVVLGLPDSVVPRYQRFLWEHPQLMWVGILIAWQIFSPIFSTVFTASLNVLYFFVGVSYG